MRYFTKKCYELMGKPCNVESVKKTISDYNAYLNNNPDLPDFARIDLHDSIITKVEEKDGKLILTLDNFILDSMVFANFKFKKQEHSLENMYWLYDEWYYENGKYILELMIGDKYGNPFCVSISAREVQAIYR